MYHQRPRFDSDKRWFLTRIFDFDVIGSGLYKFVWCLEVVSVVVNKMVN